VTVVLHAAPPANWQAGILPSRIQTAPPGQRPLRVLADGVCGDEYGRLTAITRPSVGAAPLSSGQDKDFARAQHTIGLAGRFELEFQLALNYEDQIGLVRGEPVLVDLLGHLAYPDHFDALSGEHGPDIAKRRGPNLTGLAEQGVENYGGRAPGILDCHGSWA
jgi:hypothetical protein